MNIGGGKMSERWKRKWATRDAMKQRDPWRVVRGATREAEIRGASTGPSIKKFGMRISGGKFTPTTATGRQQSRAPHPKARHGPGAEDVRELSASAEGRARISDLRRTREEERLAKQRRVEEARRQAEEERKERQRAGAGDRRDTGEDWRAEVERRHADRRKADEERVAEQKRKEMERALRFAMR